jgi:hypothetical protein
MSTRIGNLRRHMERKHAGIGKPILQYIDGNSIITPEEPPSTLHVFRDEYAIKPHVKTPFFRSNSSHIQNDDDWIDKWADKYIEPILKLNEYRARMNSINQSLSPIPSIYSSQFTGLPHYGFSSSPAYVPVERDSQDRNIISRNYDGVSGFKVGVCAHCLAIISMPIGPKDIRLQDIHKCGSMRLDSISKLDPREYAIDLLRKHQSLPELLFRLCKDWASNTSGQLYLRINSTKLLNESEDKNHEIQENYDSLSFLTRVLSESKIILTDMELLEFLRFARNQTRATLTIKSNNGEAYSEYNLAITIA